MLWLYRCHKTPLITYTHIQDEIAVGRIVHYLCGHIVFWADPLYQPPHQASNEARNPVDYEDLIRNKYTPRPVYTSSDEDNNTLDRDRAQRARHFLVGLRKWVRARFGGWNKIKQNVGRE